MTSSEIRIRTDPGAPLAVVVIGRNEGERLRQCLLSVEKMHRPEGGIEMVYVDTASEDGSADMGRGASSGSEAGLLLVPFLHPP